MLFQETYISFNCEKNKVNNNNFPRLSFYHPEFNETFELDFNDLSYTVGDRVYWLVIFANKTTTIDVRSVLGKP